MLTRYVPDFHKLSTAVTYIVSTLGIILTSQRSAESVNKALNDLPDEWKTKRHYCVGMKTGETAAKLLCLTDLAGQDCGNAESLSALIVKGSGFKATHLLNMKTENLLFFAEKNFKMASFHCHFFFHAVV